jgi:hypothetical protein
MRSGQMARISAIACSADKPTANQVGGQDRSRAALPREAMNRNCCACGTRVVEESKGVEHLRGRWRVEIVDRQVQAKKSVAL